MALRVIEQSCNQTTLLLGHKRRAVFLAPSSVSVPARLIQRRGLTVCSSFKKLLEPTVTKLTEELSMFSQSVAQVNSILMLHPETPLPIVSIARLSGLAYNAVDSALQTQEKRGMVQRSQRAGQDEFAPNRESPYYPMAYASALVDLPIAQALYGIRVYAVFAYGSLSHPGGGGPGSDLDLLIVGDVKDKADLTYRLIQVGTRIGRAIDPFVLSPEQLESARKSGDSHVASALSGVRLLGSI